MVALSNSNGSTIALEDKKEEDESDKYNSLYLIKKFENHDPKYDPADDLLEMVGSWNIYQFIHAILFVFICAFYTYSHYSPNLYLYVPEHHCHIPTSANASVDQLKALFIPFKDNSSSKYDECKIFDVDYDEILRDQSITSPDPNWNVTHCQHGWTYYTDDYFISAAVEFDWVCENSWKGPFTQLLYFIGSTVGACIFGWIGDHIGRYWTVVSVAMTLFVSGVFLGFTKGLVTFTIARFFMGIATKILMSFSFLLVIEYLSISKRTITGNLGLAFGIALPGMLMPYAFHWISYWRIFNHFLFFQMAITLIFPFIFYESFRWLIEVKRYEKAFKVLGSIARWNRRKITKEELAEVQKSYMKEFASDTKPNKEAVTSVFELLRKPRLRKHFIILILSWSTVTLLFDAHIQNVQNLNFSIYTSFAVSAGVEAPADILVIWLLDFIGRRWTTALATTLSGVSMMIAFLLVELECNSLLVMIISMVGRFFITISMNGALQIVPEILPTDLRSRGSAIVYVAGEILTLLSPYVVFSSTLYHSLPYLLLSVIAILFGLLPLLLPETSGSSLPQNAEEAEEFGRSQSFRSFPFAHRRKPTNE